MNNTDVPIWEKYTLTIEEASKYFRIGEKKLRKLAEPFIDLEAVFGKLHGLGTDPILEAAPLFGKCLHIERKALGFICPEEIPEDL